MCLDTGVLSLDKIFSCSKNRFNGSLHGLPWFFVGMRQCFTGCTALKKNVKTMFNAMFKYNCQYKT